MNDRTATIYGLSGPDGVVRYVGQTTRDAAGRLWRHRYDATRLSSPALVHAWIREIGPESVQVTILDTCDASARLVRENEWIVRLGTSEAPGLNMIARGKTQASAQARRGSRAEARRRLAGPRA